MIKPISELYKSILEFVMAAPQIQALIRQRDSHNNAYMSEISVKFFKQNENNTNLSAYAVNFFYNTRYPDQEKNDDIKCYVEVNNSEPGNYRIIKIILN